MEEAAQRAACENRNVTLFIHGLTGHLGRTRITDGLRDIYSLGKASKLVKVFSCQRREQSSGALREYLLDAWKRHPTPRIEEFSQRFETMYFDMKDPASYRNLIPISNQIRQQDPDSLQVHYLSVGPDLYNPFLDGMEAVRLLNPKDTVVVVEKPADVLIDRPYPELRFVDHYRFYKQLVQFLYWRFLTAGEDLRFHAPFTEFIEVSILEHDGLEGREFFAQTGMFDDCIRNHGLILAAYSIMESPEEWNAEQINQKVLEALQRIETLRPEDLVFGQYLENERFRDWATECADINCSADKESYAAVLARTSETDGSPGPTIGIRAGKRCRPNDKKYTGIVYTGPETDTPLAQFFRRRHGGVISREQRGFRLAMGEFDYYHCRPVLELDPNPRLEAKFSGFNEGRNKDLPPSISRDAYSRVLEAIVGNDRRYFCTREQVAEMRRICSQVDLHRPTEMSRYLANNCLLPEGPFMQNGSGRFPFPWTLAW